MNNSGIDGNDCDKGPKKKTYLQISNQKISDNPGLQKANPDLKKSIAVERRDKFIILLCLVLTLITAFFQNFYLKAPDVRDHAVFLGIILIGYVAAFLRGTRATTWGLIFLAVNLFLWARSAGLVYAALHP